MTATIDETPQPAEDGPTAPAPEGRLAHQPALDGVRALAVIAVVLYHDCVNRPTLRWIPGGFLGVDVFFVLSGFLITGILLTNRERTGRTATKEFWVRRARRLLPALLVMLLFAAAYGYFASPKWELQSLWSQTVATLLYVENWFTLYGHAGRAPIGHTWSLSIEEQWYFVWPFLLAGVLLLTRGRRRALVVTICALGIASAVSMAFEFGRGGWSHGYYSTFGRAGELLIGGLIAVVLRDWRGLRSRAGRITLEVAALASVGTLLWLFRRENPYDPFLYHGGFYLTAIATGILIVAVLEPTSPVVRRVFAWRPLAAIGLVSYGVYLFHVPLFRWMSPEATGLSNWSLLAARLAVLAVMVVVSYFLVEMPVRNGRLRGYEGRLAIVAIIATAAVMFAVTRAAIPQPSWAYAHDKLIAGAEATPPGYPRVLVAGELDAFDLGANTDNIIYSKVRGVQATAVASLYCPIIGSQPAIGNSYGPPVDCVPSSTLYRELAGAFRPHVAVLMAGRAEIYDQYVGGRILRVGTTEYEMALRHRLDEARHILQPAGKPLVLTTVPCVAGVQGDTSAVGAIGRDQARLYWINQVWNTYATNHPRDVRLIDISPVLCPNGDPRPLVDGHPVRDANGRLTRAGTDALWRYIIDQSLEVTGTPKGRTR